MTNPQQLVSKLWNYCAILRDDGLSHDDYVLQLFFRCRESVFSAVIEDKRLEFFIGCDKHKTCATCNSFIGKFL